MEAMRINCPMRHENGNCKAAGGFCTAVSDSICQALHNAYAKGSYDALKQIADAMNHREWYRQAREDRL